MNIIPMPGKIKTKTGTCVLDEGTAIILDQSKPLIPLEGPLLLTEYYRVKEALPGMAVILDSI